MFHIFKIPRVFDILEMKRINTFFTHLNNNGKEILLMSIIRTISGGILKLMIWLESSIFTLFFF
jgi:hypothetical protein